MKKQSLVLIALSLIQLAEAAPAPLDVEKRGFLDLLKSFFSKDDDSTTATTTTAAATAATATATAAAATTSSTSSNLDSLVDKWLKYIGYDSDDSSSSYTTQASTWVSVGTQVQTLTAATSSVAQTTSTSSGSSETGSGEVTGEDTTFAQNILDAHNKYRALHDAPDLVWNNDAYEYAQNNADNYDCSGILTHTHGEYGENLAAGYSSGPASVKAWYDEGESYDYSLANTYDHFTQVVWKSTTSVGCAYKDCTSENWGLYVVCEYDPPGNVIGQNKANVLES